MSDLTDRVWRCEIREMNEAQIARKGGKAIGKHFEFVELKFLALYCNRKVLQLQ